MKKEFGFTLLELMVAIAIVAVLATIGFTLFQGAQAQARDAKRKADIDAIAQVLENNFNPFQGSYPSPPSDQFSSGARPVDPLGPSGVASGYTYSISALPNSSYVVCAKIEKLSGNYSDNVGTGPGTGFYCRKNLQQ